MNNSFKKTTIVLLMSIFFISMSFKGYATYYLWHVSCTYPNGKHWTSQWYACYPESSEWPCDWASLFRLGSQLCNDNKGNATMANNTFDNVVVNDRTYNLHNSGNTVNWSSQFENKVDQYNVYKSNDNGNTWNYLGSISATAVGNTTSVNNYSIDDPNFSAGDIYKVADADINGDEFEYVDAEYDANQESTAEVSEWTSASGPTLSIDDANSTKQIGVNIAPNPVHSVLSVNFDYKFTVKEAPKIFIYNVVGQLVSSVYPVDRLNSIDFSSLPAGIYMVKIQQEGVVKVQKVLKN